MKRGFTLIEMSIVIVVIAFIAGATTIGAEVRKNARMGTLVSDAQKIKAAVVSFKDKYKYYPGDFPNAEALWGTKPTPACNSVAATFNSTLTTTTCNGTGNGVIGQRNGTASDIEKREGFYLWQHLANAQLVTGKYSGFPTANAGNNSQQITPETNVPRSAYRPYRGFTIEYWSTVNATAAADDPTNGNFPVAGKLGHVASWSHSAKGITRATMLTSEEAQYIDIKIDDGLPLQGKVFASETGDASNCMNGTAYNAAVGSYCSQYFRLFLE